MKQSPSFFIFGFCVLFLFTQSNNCQIIEESNTVITDEEKVQLPDSAQDQQNCFPPCRQGYLCHNGECISRCNPPCPDDMECRNDGECHSKDMYSELVEFKKKLRGISRFKKVASGDEVIQGLIVKTNRANTEIQIGDTSLTFDKDLYLTAPGNDYMIYLKAPKTNIKIYKIELQTGNVIELYSPLRPVRINIGASAGPAYFNKNISLAVNFDAGLNVVSKHFVGITGSAVTSIWNEDEDLSNTSDTLYPDTSRYSYSECYGLGITYGYTGLHFKRIATIIPKISIGYWRLFNRTSYSQRDHIGNKYVSNQLNDMKTVSYERYYVKPGVELRIGYRIFGFRMHIDTFIGESVGSFSVNLGIIFRIL